MIKKPVTIRNSMDMETRPIAHLVQEASQYKSQVYIEMDDKKINAKSIMGMMSMNLSEGLPLVAMHWEHRFNHMVRRYNDIYRV